MLGGRVEVRRPASDECFMPEILGVRMEGATVFYDEEQSDVVLHTMCSSIGILVVQAKCRDKWYG